MSNLALDPRPLARSDRRQAATVAESFRLVNGVARRSVSLRSGLVVTSDVGAVHGQPSGRAVTAEVVDQALLCSSVAPPLANGGELGVVDLFSGLGGLSLGVAEAARAVGRRARCVGVDSDGVAIAAYQRNMSMGRGLRADVGDVFDGPLGGRLTSSERAFRRLGRDTEVLLGGPPCQGHSALNNRTRHADVRNGLFLRMVRAAEVLEPEHVIIENVPGALRDRGSVVQRSMEALSELGYGISHGVVDMAQVGVPQLRKRLIVLASRASTIPSIEEVVSLHRTTVRTVRWGIEDLAGITRSRPVDLPARSAPQTRRRIDVLFDQGLWNLPNEYRPKCHANGHHSYGSIYGRLQWDKPAQTITTGFYSMCMGRYVHPSRRRTITAHEAARLQFLPDYVSLDEVGGRGDLARLVGNAVPIKLGYVLGLELLR